jgi:hypothetical protein
VNPDEAVAVLEVIEEARAAAGGASNIS